MNTISENITITDNRPPSADLKQSPPAFLDLADSVSLPCVPYCVTLTPIPGGKAGN